MVKAMNKPLALLLSLLLVGPWALREYGRFQRGVSLFGDLAGPHGGWLIGVMALVAVGVLAWIFSSDRIDEPPPGA